MKASELIAQLQTEIERRGDLPVVASACRDGYTELDNVCHAVGICYRQARQPYHMVESDDVILVTGPF